MPDVRPIWYTGFTHDAESMRRIKKQVAFFGRFEISADLIGIAKLKYRLHERTANASTLPGRLYTEHAKIPVFPLNRVHAVQVTQNAPSVRQSSQAQYPGHAGQQTHMRE